MGDFDRLASYYDLDYQDFAADIDLYRNYASRAGQSVLELGCGTGRVLVPLAQAGHRVTGIDISSDMLAISRAKAQEAGVLNNSTLIHADARTMKPDGLFDMAFAATNTFMLFVELPDQLAVLQQLHLLLRPGALLIFDLFNPHPSQLGEATGGLVHEYTKDLPERAVSVSKFQICRVDVARQHLATTYLYDEVDRQGRVSRVMLSFAMHYFWLREMQLLLDRAGFLFERVFGSYDLDDYGSESERMIVLARRGGAS